MKALGGFDKWKSTGGQRKERKEKAGPSELGMKAETQSAIQETHPAKPAEWKRVGVPGLAAFQCESVCLLLRNKLEIGFLESDGLRLDACMMRTPTGSGIR